MSLVAHIDVNIYINKVCSIKCLYIYRVHLIHQYNHSKNNFDCHKDVNNGRVLTTLKRDKPLTASLGAIISDTPMSKSFAGVSGNKGQLNSTMYNSKYMGVSKNRGTPKWMVYNGKPY